jgi:hypothetical protein
LLENPQAECGIDDPLLQDAANALIALVFAILSVKSAG